MIMGLSEAAVTAGLKLIANEATFISIISNLQNQINDLNDKKSQYINLRNRIDDVWTTSDGESEKYKEAINIQLDNIEKTLVSVQAAFDEFRNLDENLNAALSSAKNLAEAVAEEAKELFI